MTTHRPPTHYGQLLAAVVTFTAMTGTLAIGINGTDGPDAAAWTPAVGGIITVWVFALAWVLLALVLSTTAALRALRHRPAPGVQRRPAPSLTDLADRVLIERCRAGDNLADAVVADVPRWLRSDDAADDAGRHARHGAEEALRHVGKVRAA